MSVQSAGGNSIPTDAPPRWTDAARESKSGRAKDLITREIEQRFGTRPNEDSGSDAGIGRGRVQPHGSHPPSPAPEHKPAAMKAPARGEVLQPNTLPPGTAPDSEASPMQEFCGSADANWGPIIGAHFSPCFVHAFLFAAVDLGFVAAAALRLRELLSLPNPPPRALSQTQIMKVGGASLVAMYNLIMFAVHLAYDYGAPYQWIMYPMSCLTWSLCVVLLVVEAKYASPTNWVCKSFWLASFFVASLLLWTNIADHRILHSHDFVAFLVHYLLYAGMAAMAVFLKGDQDEYSKLAFDISEISMDDEQTAESEDLSSFVAQQAKVARVKWGSGSETRAQLTRVMKLLSDDKWLGAAALACCFIGAPIEVVQFIYAGMVVDDCAVPEGPSSLAGYIAVLVALYLIEAVAAASQLILTTVLGERLATRLRRAAFSSALQQEILYIEGGRVSEVTNSVEHDVQRVQEASTVQLCQVLHSLIQSLVGTVFLFVLSWKLTLVAIAILPVVALMMLVQSTVIQSYSRRSVEALEGVISYALEVLESITTVRSFAKEGKEKARFGVHVLQSYTVSWRMGVAHGIAEGVGVLILKLCLVLAVFYGGSLVHHNELSGGILISYSFIALQVVMALSVLPPVLADISNAVLAGQRVLELMDRQPMVNPQGGLTLPSCEGRIELKAVTFNYPSHPDMPALHRVSLVIEAGSHVAIFGPRGSGKTSLLALVERFFDPQEGLVLLDDTDISTFDPQWLHHQIALVSQEPVLFSSSIAENISMGQQVSRADIEAAAAKVNLHQQVMALPDGYETPVGPIGSEIDPLIRHKISIARVLLKDAKILLLDEPTASLDAKTHAQVTEALRSAISGRTTLSVSHKPDAFQRGADFVGVLNKGILVEFGAPSELSTQGGFYQAMHDRQDGEDSLTSPGEPAAPAKEMGSKATGASSSSRALELIEDFEHQLGLTMTEDGPALAGLQQLIGQFKSSL